MHPFWQDPIICIDLETTGANATQDRITEIGIVEIFPDGSTQEWQSLINPQTTIPSFISKLTGITNEMVQEAPLFSDIASVLQTKLEGKLFVAHNVRFDYAFVKQEFLRCGIPFKARTLCTVRLSRQLYPKFIKHNLDSIIQRLNLTITDRHRALTDARVVALFLKHAQDVFTADQLTQAIKKITHKPSLPPQLKEEDIEELPEKPGVYLFYGENELPLYVGKSINIRERVLSHFNADHSHHKELRLSQQITRIDHRSTVGELGALLLEAKLIKQLQPLHNHRLRREQQLCSWHWQRNDSQHSLQLTNTHEIDFTQTNHYFGVFQSRRKAQDTLRAIADAHGLCLMLLGLESGTAGKACFRHQINKCHGACCGKETHSHHELKTQMALEKIKLKNWKWPSAIAIEDRVGMEAEYHLIDQWAYFGTFRQFEEVLAANEVRKEVVFDYDVYKILVKYIFKSSQLIVLNQPPMPNQISYHDRTDFSLSVE